MTMKKYLQFINESKGETLEETWQSIFPMDIEQIEQFFYNLTDYGWGINIEFGFSTKNKNKFTQDVISNVPVIPAYNIEIYSCYKYTKPKPFINKSEDETDDLLFAVGILGEKVEVIIQDRNKNKINVENITLNKGKILIRDEVAKFIPGFGTEKRNKYADEIFILAIEKKEKSLTQLQLANYYGWRFHDSDSDGNIYLHTTIDYLAKALPSTSEYKSIIKDGMETMESFYRKGDYRPSLIYVLDILNSKNRELMLNNIIKNEGGWEKFNNSWVISHMNLEIENKEDFLKYNFKNHSFQRTFELFEIYDEIVDEISTWRMNAHIHDNYESIIKSFDKELNKYISFTKFTKESSNPGFFTSSSTTYYKVKFENDWIVNYDYHFLTNFPLSTIFYEYCVNYIGKIEIFPTFGDYGHVDYEKLNDEIASILNSKN